MKKACIIAFILTFMVASLAVGQDEQGYVKDLLEVNFFGGGGIPSGDIKDFGDSVGAKTGFSFGTDIGLFITESWVTGFSFTYTSMSIEDQVNSSGLHHKLYSPNFFVKYYFIGQSDFMPYVKAHAGLDFPKFATFVDNPTGKIFREISYDPVFGYGGGAGFFYFTTDFSGLFAEVNYHRAQSSGTSADYHGTEYKFDANINVIDIHAGIRILIAPPQ